MHNILCQSITTGISTQTNNFHSKQSQQTIPRLFLNCLMALYGAIETPHRHGTEQGRARYPTCNVLHDMHLNVKEMFKIGQIDNISLVFTAQPFVITQHATISCRSMKYDGNILYYNLNFMLPTLKSLPKLVDFISCMISLLCRTDRISTKFLWRPVWLLFVHGVSASEESGLSFRVAIQLHSVWE